MIWKVIFVCFVAACVWLHFRLIRRYGADCYNAGVKVGVDHAFDEAWKQQGLRCAKAVGLLAVKGIPLSVEAFDDALAEVDAQTLAEEASAMDLEDWYAKQDKK